MTPDTAPPSPPAWRPWLLALALWLLLAAAASVALWNSRSDALEGQRRELNLLSLALTDELDRGLRGAEEGLRAVRAELLEGRLPLAGSAPHTSASTAALRTRAELMPLVRTLWLSDRNGRVLAASDATPAPPLAGFLPRLDKLADEAMSVSQPFSNPGEEGQLVALALALPTTGPGTDQNRGGWLLAAMPASALLGAFSAARPAADARMAVLRSDGVRLAAANTGPPAATEAAEAALAQDLASRPSLTMRSFSDGSQHLVGLHSVPRYGIHVLVSRDLNAMLAAWRRAAEGAGIALALLLAMGAAAVRVVQRAERKRQEAQRALQAQLSRASKLESLGTLAGGVAHDFNNVLASIVGFGEMAQDDAPPGSDQARQLGKVLQAAMRGKALVERILAFSRGGARSSAVFELEPVVEEVLTLLSASLRPGVVLERALEAPAARLRGDATQAFEAVMNLCTNAMQAMQSMPQGGMLSVQLQREAVTAQRVLSHSALAPGDYLALSVTDQGEGIRPEVMEHLFEPFFTTRSAQTGTNTGTGLGLAVVHGVVAEFGGAIDVQSQPGQGARFTLYLPECSDALGAPEPEPALPRPGTGQRLLVIDDEPELVGLALEMLRGLGYAPEGYIDAAAALQALRQRPGQFAAVITDEVMPELSGTGLTQALRAFEPHLPVLLISGYGGGLLAQRAAAAGVSRVLAKPLQRADLARALADLLR